MARTGIPTGDGSVIDPSSDDDDGGSNANDISSDIGGLLGDPAGDADRDTDGGGGGGGSTDGGGGIATDVTEDIRDLEDGGGGDIDTGFFDKDDGSDPVGGGEDPRDQLTDTNESGSGSGTDGQPADIINLTSNDPRYRPDLFRDPAQQKQFTEQFEQRLRQQFDDPSIVLGPGEIQFEEIDDGRYRGTVGTGTLLRIPEVRQRATEDLRDEFERSIGREVGPGDINLQPVDGGVRGELTEAFIADTERRRLELAADLAGPGGRVSTVGRGETGVIEGPRLVSSVSVAETGGGSAFELTGGGAARARRQIRQQLESRLGVDLSESDIEFDRQDGRIVGQLTPAAQDRIRAQQKPLVQLTQGTPLEGVFETGASIGVRQARERRRRRERLFGAIGQRERVEEFVEDVGLGGALEEFRRLQETSQAELARLRGSVVEGGRRGVTLAKAAGALPLGIALEQTDIDPEQLEAVPDPTEEPEAAIALGVTGVGAPEPATSVVGGALALAGGAVVASRVLDKIDAKEASIEQAQLAAEAEIDEPVVTTSPTGLFAPEIEQPEEPIGRGFFQPDMPVGPSSIELPELLPPTDPRSNIKTGRLTRPELELPEEPAGTGLFPPEQSVPEEPVGSGLFPSEQEVPTLDVAMTTQRQRPTTKNKRKSGGKSESDIITAGDIAKRIGEGPPITPGQRRLYELARKRTSRPSARYKPKDVEFEFDEPSGVLDFITRPNPRSMELRRIQTEEGEFEVGPELTRFLEATELEQFDEPELEPTEEAATLPPGQDIGAELATLEAASQLVAQREASAADAVEAAEDTVAGVDLGPRLDEATSPAVVPKDDVIDREVTRAASETTTVEEFATPTPTVTEEDLALSTVFEEQTTTTPPDFAEPPPEPPAPEPPRRVEFDFDRFEEELFEEADPFADKIFESGIADVEAAERIEERILGSEGGSGGGGRSFDDIEREILGE